MGDEGEGRQLPYHVRLQRPLALAGKLRLLNREELLVPPLHSGAQSRGALAVGDLVVASECCPLGLCLGPSGYTHSSRVGRIQRITPGSTAPQYLVHVLSNWPGLEETIGDLQQQWDWFTAECLERASQEKAAALHAALRGKD